MNTSELIKVNDSYKKLVIKLILNGKITIQEIDRELRMQSPSLYVAALRVSRDDCKSYCDTLQLLITDIVIIEDVHIKKFLSEIYYNNYYILIDMYPNAKTIPYFDFISHNFIDYIEQERLKYEFDKATESEEFGKIFENDELAKEFENAVGDIDDSDIEYF